jgi:glycosyltransferase involved in cell wall biosynthesis
MIEAVACGTPVIAYRQGSVPEVIDEGVTGFGVDNEEEAVRALGRLGEIDRHHVRACFERRLGISGEDLAGSSPCDAQRNALRCWIKPSRSTRTLQPVGRTAPRCKSLWLNRRQQSLIWSER